MAVWFVLHYPYIIVFFFNDDVHEGDDLAGNLFAISAYLFPPGWVPSFAMGIGAYFLFSHYRPHEHPEAWKWGVLTDALSVIFCLFFLLHGFEMRHLEVTKMVEQKESGRTPYHVLFVQHRLFGVMDFQLVKG